MLICQAALYSIVTFSYFNTSHVNVNHLRHLIFHLSKTNFNTSHVNVNPQGGGYGTGTMPTFQYISC